MEGHYTLGVHRRSGRNEDEPGHSNLGPGEAAGMAVQHSDDTLVHARTQRARSLTEGGA